MPQPSQPQLPDENEFLDWLSHPVTRQYQAFLKKWQESLKDQWGGGAFQGTSPMVTFSANAQALGQFAILGQLQEVDYEKFFGVMKDD